MKKITYILKKITSSVLVFTLSLTGLVLTVPDAARADTVLDESKCVRFEDFARTHEIPNTTIFIGTHLITIESASDELWTLAEESQGLSNQYSIYYKSELSVEDATDTQRAGWFEITSAEGTQSITGQEDNKVEESELADLLVEYYTFNNGQTKKAIDDSSHNIFDGEFPYYDLYHLDELEGMKNQYEMILSRNNDDSRMDKFYIGLMQGFYGRDLRNDVCHRCDQQLSGLQVLHDNLKNQEMDTEADIVYKLMARLDHQRRAEIFFQLTEDENNPILENLLTRASGGNRDDDDDDDDFITNYDLTDSMNDAIGDCQTSYLNHSGNSLERDGDWLVDELTYNSSLSVIEVGGSGNVDGALNDIQKLGNLFNISDEIVEKRVPELELILSEIMNPVIAKFVTAVSKGPSPEFLEAKNSDATEAELKRILDAQESEIDAVRIELQAMITAQTDRQGAEDAITFTKARIDATQEMIDRVPDTESGERAGNQLTQHMNWLWQKLEDIYKKSGKESDLDRLNNLYNEKLNQIEKALNNNKLGEARRLSAERDMLKDKIDAETLRAKADAKSASDKAEIDAMNGSQTMEDMIQDIQDSAASGAIDSDLANSLLNTLTGGDGTGGDGTGSGDGTGEGGVLGAGGLSANATEAEQMAYLNAKLTELLGDMSQWSAEDAGAAIRAMELLYRDGDEAAGSVAADLAGRFAGKKSFPYIYKRLKDTAKYEYANLRVVANVAGYRYVYRTGNRQATLTGIKPANKNTIYGFNVGSSEVTLNGEEAGELTDNVRIQKYPYITADSVKKYFKCIACDISKSTNYGLCINIKMEKQAQDIYKELKG